MGASFPRRQWEEAESAARGDTGGAALCFYSVTASMDSIETQFDQAYLAALPPELQALMNMPADSADSIETRVARGAALAGKGYTIDAPIMVYSWDAFLAMTER